MNLVSILKKVEKLTIDNSPSILTAIGVTGTITTAYLTGRATFKAAEIIHAEEEVGGKAEDGWPTVKERTRFVWKFYIPAIGTGILTIVCIIGANKIGSRRAAAVAAAYSISEKAFSEYKTKVIEKIGAPKEQIVRDEIAQERINRDPVGAREIIITGSGEVLCYEAFTGRYFMSSMEELKRGQNDTNYLVLNDGYASLSDFYNKIGIPTTANSEEVGWNTDKLMELDFSTCMSEDSRPCISIAFHVAPIRDYYRSHTTY
jgi:hypothetical protein